MEERIVASQADALVGWRAWGLRELVSEQGAEGHRVTYRVGSLWTEHREAGEWDPQRAPHAKCRSELRKSYPHKDKEVPFPACHCGYSAHRTVDDLVWDLCGRTALERLVIGEVDLWGKVLLGEHLVRSSFAAPRSFYVINDRWTWDHQGLLVQELAAYNLPIHSLHWAEFRLESSDRGVS